MHAPRFTGILVALFSLCLPAFTQSNPTGAPPSGHSASCAISAAAPSAADTAYSSGDYKKAANLYAADFAKDPKDHRSRQRQIDSLISQDKLDDASKLADAWTAVEVTNPYAVLAAADVRFAEGDWLEFYGLTLKSQKLDPCLPEPYQAMARYETLAGYRATARKHITLAHQLAPNDLAIRLDWIDSLETAERRVEEFTRYVDDNKDIDETRRRTLLNHVARWNAESQNHCELTSATGTASFPMTPILGDNGIDYWGIEVAFNGKKRILQIDTNTNGFFLTKSAITGVDLTKIDTSHINRFGDQSGNAATAYSAASVHIGGLEFKNCVVEGSENFSGQNRRGTSPGKRLDEGDGSIGADVFDRYLVTLDYFKHEVRLEPLPPLPNNASAASLDSLSNRSDPNWTTVDRYIAPQMKSWTKIYRRDQSLVVPTHVNQGDNKLFVVDTGAYFNLIDVRAAREFTTSNEATYMFGDLSGPTKKAFETGTFTLDFAGLRLPVKTMTAMDFSRLPGVTGISGFIGYPTLQQLILHLDYRDNLVLFEAPTAKRM